MKKTLILVASFALLILAGCKDDPVTTDDTTPVLNKELLLNKYWINQSQTVDHYFNSNGTYGLNNGFGTWEWINNSDTMKIHFSGTGSDQIWVFNTGNSADRMECKLSGTTGWGEYRTSW
ncbi:MAG: hypothetical protein H6607_09485 [Flavobacteriales bacterium]|nr:hypothetical protein [Flavobacteriales bacterium]